MKLKIILSALLICLCALPDALAQSEQQNYGTDGVAMMVRQANTLYSKGKLEEAKVLYEQALASGDRFFSKKCTAQLDLIRTLMAAREKKSGTVFTISQDTVRINCLGGDYPVHVTGSDWNASVNGSDDWCRIGIDRKMGLVKIYIAPNEGTDDRSTVIEIRNGNGQSKTVQVINEGAPEFLRSSTQSLVFTPTGETSIVDIDANTDWDISDVPGWLEAIKGDSDIRFTADANDDNRDRIAQVRVETPSRNEITINIIQGASLDSLAFSKNDLHFGPEGGDEYIRVLTDADDWRFGDFPYWCQLKRIDDHTIHVHCTPNEPVDMPREASVNVTTGNQTLGINVSQDPKPIVQLIPQDGIGGRRVSFGITAGYIYPMISVNSSSQVTASPVNYATGSRDEQVSYSSSGGFTVGAHADIRLYKNLYLNTGLDFMYYRYRNDLAGRMTMAMPQTSRYYLAGDALASFNEEYTMAELGVPVLFSYRIPVTKTSHFRVDLGPVLSVGLSSDLDLSGKTDSDELRAYRIVNGVRTDEFYDNYVYSSHLNYSGKFDMFSESTSLRTMTSDGNNASSGRESSFDASPYRRVNFGLRAGVGYEFMGISISVSYQWMITNMADRKYWDGDRWTVFDNAAGLMSGYSQHNNLLQVTIGYTFRY
ncbi:MAG: outer membrane beta-barrel protein [Bacteroidetes bacterium]|uniref:Outer membrane beta-barrel protein n=1 Tax=Candidatus Cryptobacteroides merdavium TaxID=2840769 RepID=A0A9D9HBK4_9BACT|nr:outer membrane beta-barrel protein [Candidatus Cryptobacteroides merdavium]